MKSHEFFKEVVWEDVRDKNLDPPPLDEDSVDKIASTLMHGAYSANC